MSLPQWLRPARRREEGGEHDDISARSPSPMAKVEANNALTVTVQVTEHSDPETTPKVTSAEPGTVVPKLALEEDDEEHCAKEPGTNAPSSPLPAVGSSQRTSSIPGPPNGTLTPSLRTPGNLMPPPPRPSPIPPPSSAASLRVPTSGPLPNRGPPANSQQRVGGSSLSVNGTVTPPKARGKVLLAPGHSPMDWAALTRSTNLSGVSTVQRVTPSMLKSMTGRKGKPAWTSWQGKVYNITPYLPFHPGGEAELMKAAGRDGTKLFMEVHPWVNWENMLSTCLVGVLVPEGYGVANGESSLESID